MKLETFWKEGYGFLESEFQSVNQTLSDIFDSGWSSCPNRDIRINSDKFINPLCQKIEGLLRSNGSTTSGWVKNAYVHFLGKTCLFTEELLVENARKLLTSDCYERSWDKDLERIKPQWWWKNRKSTWKNLWNITRETFIFQANKIVVNIVTDVGINITDFNIVTDKSDVNFYLNFTFLEPNAPEIHLVQTTLNRIYLLVHDVSFLADDCLFNQSGIKARSDAKEINHSVIFRRCTFTGYKYDGFIQIGNISAVLESCTFSNLNDTMPDPLPLPYDYYSKLSFFHFTALKCSDSELKISNSSIKNSVIKLGRPLLVTHFCNITFSHVRVVNNSYKDNHIPYYIVTFYSFFTTHNSSITIRDSWFSQNNIKVDPVQPR